MSEDNAATEKRKIINRFLTQLTREEPQMYYASTAEISRSIYTLIKEHTNRLSVEEQALVRNISVEEIQSILGFNLK
ncbi:hypothetical protein ACS8E3_03505 [Psychrobacter sp. 2Y5]|uniref:hypothetical protein n=1 Tax=unclassified Psychrobacter TaxID=196806 RepID=UPI003F48B102